MEKHVSVKWEIVLHLLETTYSASLNRRESFKAHRVDISVFGCFNGTVFILQT